MKLFHEAKRYDDLKIWYGSYIVFILKKGATQWIFP